jgi:hypothetical protein
VCPVTLFFLKFCFLGLVSCALTLRYFRSSTEEAPLDEEGHQYSDGKPDQPPQSPGGNVPQPDVEAHLGQQPEDLTGKEKSPTDKEEVLTTEGPQIPQASSNPNVVPTSVAKPTEIPANSAKADAAPSGSKRRSSADYEAEGLALLQRWNTDGLRTASEVSSVQNLQKDLLRVHEDFQVTNSPLLSIAVYSDK